MKGFLAVIAFFAVFAGVVGGGLRLIFWAARELALPEAVENVFLCVGAVLSLVIAGLLMKQLHAMIQRRL